MKPAEEEPAKTEISVDWERFRESLFRFTVGIGLICGWLLLINLMLGILFAVGIAISKLPFAWLLGSVALIPISFYVWWISFHVSMEGLEDMGIQLKGAWAWIVIPVAPLLALVSFGITFLAGIGSFAKNPAFIGISFVLGGVVLIVFLLLLASLRM